MVTHGCFWWLVVAYGGLWRPMVAYGRLRWTPLNKSRPEAHTEHKRSLFGPWSEGSRPRRCCWRALGVGARCCSL
eukprot:4456802-Alexandrium_andersonii.AAC.1